MPTITRLVTTAALCALFLLVAAPAAAQITYGDVGGNPTNHYPNHRCTGSPVGPSVRVFGDDVPPPHQAYAYFENEPAPPAGFFNNPTAFCFDVTYVATNVWQDGAFTQSYHDKIAQWYVGSGVTSYGPFPSSIDQYGQVREGQSMGAALWGPSAYGGSCPSGAAQLNSSQSCSMVSSSQWQSHANTYTNGGSPSVLYVDSGARSCFSECAASGYQGCTEQRRYDYFSGAEQVTCIVNPSSSNLYQRSPQTTFQGGEPRYETTWNSYVNETVVQYQCSPPGQYSCVPLSQPNLTPTTGSNITITAGQTATFTGTTVNNGQSTAGAGFYDLFLVYNTGYGYEYANGSTYWANTDPVYSGAIGAGGSASRVGYYTFNTPGTYYYRLCSDWGGQISETNEGDNCGGFATVTVVAPIPPPPTGLYHVCNAGGTQVTLYWNAAPGAVDYYVRLYDGISSNPYAGYAGYNDYYGGTSITYNIVPGRYHDWWVHSRNGSGYSAPSYGSFTCAGFPDLTAGGVSVSQTVPGRSTTLSAVATNQGIGASGGFPMLFQIANQAQTQTIALLNSGYASLSPGQSTTMTNSSYVPSAGTYAIRACANYNTAWQAITSESNYGNNCGAWSTVTFQNTGSLSCTASPAVVKAGESATYTVTPFSGAGGPYSWNDFQGGSYGSGSSVVRMFSAVGNYSMSVSGDNTINPSYTCYAYPNGGGPNADGTPGSGAVTFVRVGCAAPNTASLSANTTRVRQGGTATLTWSGAGINTSCVLSGPGISQTIPANTCAVPTQTTQTPPLTTQSRYCNTCDGSIQQCVTVNVIPLYEEF